MEEEAWGFDDHLVIPQTKGRILKVHYPDFKEENNFKGEMTFVPIDGMKWNPVTQKWDHHGMFSFVFKPSEEEVQNDNPVFQCTYKCKDE